ncbi:adenosine deaminase family protein [Occallatibacter savannae]|uniref:adenosine deaminase family protein n=1 Tax=Occallatibacter savannae TaxID=1002691 RepID=UPI0013A55AF9|nr:adenosine deaminase [Occallatibacter savannae]
MLTQSLRLSRLVSSTLVTSVLSLGPAVALAAAPQQGASTRAEHEAHATRAYERAVHQGPLAVQAFLATFPKGADLHFHLTAGVYAETLIRAAAEDRVCIDADKAQFARDEQGKTLKEPCAAPLVSAAELNGSSLTPAEQDLYDRIVDAFSLRNYVPTSGYSGHDQFFATFDRFGGLDKGHIGQWLDEITRRSDAENNQYLELMHTPSFGHAARIAHEIGWNPDFSQMRQSLLDHGLRDEIATDREEIQRAVSARSEIQKCGTPQASSACKVEVRFIYQILRAYSPEQVFAQTLLGVETVEQAIDQGSDDWVGLNFVQPEDYLVSMRDYSLHMKMIDYLHGLYPKVHITLHAGELAPGMVPPEGLRFHVRQAVEIGHAERIGHGVDVMFENEAPELLKEMARKHVMVEINLTSNDGILGITGDRHPFQYYRAAHVPVTLSTDDQAVSRIDLTHEYVRAANEYHLSYADLKQLVRTGMEHNFLPGSSLWAVRDAFDALSPACRGQVVGEPKPSESCKSFLDANEKAAAQWELERRFREFEAKY